MSAVVGGLGAYDLAERGKEGVIKGTRRGKVIERNEGERGSGWSKKESDIPARCPNIRIIHFINIHTHTHTHTQTLL